jgi:hypothetical protein
MRRCKLISPTNLLLETPILSPVEESEYLLFGVKEYQRRRREEMITGALLGALAAIGLALCLTILKGAL